MGRASALWPAEVGTVVQVLLGKLHQRPIASTSLPSSEQVMFCPSLPACTPLGVLQSAVEMGAQVSEVFQDAFRSDSEAPPPLAGGASKCMKRTATPLTLRKTP